MPAGARKKFGPGQYRVNTEIAPGRYYSDPTDGCYFERQKGLGGTLDDIITNEFIAYDAGQWIVDIKPTDLAFQTDDDCGIWYNTPRAGAQATITPGMWLVGPQIRSGTYRAATSPGCYWERLRNFSNTIGGVIANNFVSGGGARSVSIRTSDLGFDSDDDCGVWVRTGSSGSGSAELSVPAQEQTEADIQRNRELQQRQAASPKPLTNAPEE